MISVKSDPDETAWWWGFVGSGSKQNIVHISTHSIQRHEPLEYHWAGSLHLTVHQPQNWGISMRGDVPAVSPPFISRSTIRFQKSPILTILEGSGSQK